MTLQEIIADIHGINAELTGFEKKYGLLSDVFYEWYCSGEEPEDDSWVLDLSLWAGLYEAKLERERMFHTATAQKKAPLRIMRYALNTTASPPLASVLSIPTCPS